MFRGTPQDLHSLHEAKKHIDNQQYNEALFHLEHSPFRDNFWYFYQALCYFRLNHPTDAIQSMSYIQGYLEPQHIILLSDCYIAIGDYLSAIHYLKFISNSTENKKILIQIAKLYQAEAMRIPEDTTEKQALLDDAIASYQRYPNYQNNTQILLQLASVYELKKEYQNALNIYYRFIPGKNPTLDNRIQTQISELTHLVRAQQSALFDNAPAMTSEHYAALQQARRCFATSRYQEAILYYEFVPNDFKNIETLELQGLCYKEMGQFFDASQLYSDLYYNRCNDARFYHNMMWCIEQSQPRQHVPAQSIFAAASGTQPSSEADTTYTLPHNFDCR
ncbi:MAG: hypothetical protein K0U37_08355 [Gammaproteobacteria bacterium]|nr:hypothetical protein [Gammaproteobacteria bacterium]